MCCTANVADGCPRHVQNFDDAAARKDALRRYAVEIFVGKQHVPQKLSVADALLAQQAVCCSKTANVLHEDGCDAVTRPAVHAVLVGSLDGGEMWLGLVKKVVNTVVSTPVLCEDVTLLFFRKRQKYQCGEHGCNGSVLVAVAAVDAAQEQVGSGAAVGVLGYCV